MCLPLTPAVPPSPHIRSVAPSGSHLGGPRPACQAILRHRARDFAFPLNHVVPEGTCSSPPQPSLPPCLLSCHPQLVLLAEREEMLPLPPPGQSGPAPRSTWSWWEQPRLHVAVPGSGARQLPATVGRAFCQGALDTLAGQVWGSDPRDPRLSRMTREAGLGRVALQPLTWLRQCSWASAWPWSGLTWQEAAWPQAPLPGNKAGVEENQTRLCSFSHILEGGQTVGSWREGSF